MQNESDVLPSDATRLPSPHLPILVANGFGSLALAFLIVTGFGWGGLRSPLFRHVMAKRIDDEQNESYRQNDDKSGNGVSDGHALPPSFARLRMMMRRLRYSTNTVAKAIRWLSAFSRASADCPARRLAIDAIGNAHAPTPSKLIDFLEPDDDMA
jgi:hypothetical protein